MLWGSLLAVSRKTVTPLRPRPQIQISFAFRAGTFKARARTVVRYAAESPPIVLNPWPPAKLRPDHCIGFSAAAPIGRPKLQPLELSRFELPSVGRALHRALSCRNSAGAWLSLKTGWFSHRAVGVAGVDFQAELDSCRGLCSPLYSSPRRRNNRGPPVEALRLQPVLCQTIESECSVSRRIGTNLALTHPGELIPHDFWLVVALEKHWGGAEAPRAESGKYSKWKSYHGTENISSGYHIGTQSHIAARNYRAANACGISEPNKK